MDNHYSKAVTAAELRVIADHMGDEKATVVLTESQFGRWFGEPALTCMKLEAEMKARGEEFEIPEEWPT